MRPNKLTQGANIRWESSRMMLPEHVQALQKYRRELLRKTKPELDEQQLEEIAIVIQNAYVSRTPVTIVIFGVYADEHKTGVVIGVNEQLQQIKLKCCTSDHTEWIDWTTIIAVWSRDE